MKGLPPWLRTRCPAIKNTAGSQLVPFFERWKCAWPRRDGTVQPLQSESSTRICIVCGCINIWEKLWSLICQNCAQLLFGDNLLWIRLFPTQGNHSHDTYLLHQQGHIGGHISVLGRRACRRAWWPRWQSARCSSCPSPRCPSIFRCKRSQVSVCQTLIVYWSTSENRCIHL